MHNELKLLCRNVRGNILELAHATNEGHIPSSFSVVEILVTLFDFKRHNLFHFLNHFNLSKGHAVFALYSVMKEFEAISAGDYASICQENSKFIGHVPQVKELGLRYGTGSLGHGFPFSVGQSLSDMLRGKSDRRFVIIGDGEVNEGSVWEALNLMHKFKSLNIDLIVDYNASTERAIPSVAFKPALKSFDNFIEVDGHDVAALRSVWDESKCFDGVRVIWANTIKGYGLVEMQNNPAWHHRMPDADALERFKTELRTR